jgi:hypothetical protein
VTQLADFVHHRVGAALVVLWLPSIVGLATNLIGRLADSVSQFVHIRIV